MKLMKICRERRFFVDVPSLEAVSKVLKAKAYDVREVDLRWIPANTVTVEDPELAASLMKMMDGLRRVRRCAVSDGEF